MVCIHNGYTYIAVQAHSQCLLCFIVCMCMLTAREIGLLLACELHFWNPLYFTLPGCRTYVYSIFLRLNKKSMLFTCLHSTLLEMLPVLVHHNSHCADLDEKSLYPSFSSMFFHTQGTHECLKGNAKALSTVTAIIDGTGSIGQYGWCNTV